MNKCGHRYKFIKNGLKALAVLKGAAPRAGGSFDGPTRASIPDPHPNRVGIARVPNNEPVSSVFRETCTMLFADSSACITHFNAHTHIYASL